MWGRKILEGVFCKKKTLLNIWADCNNPKRDALVFHGVEETGGSERELRSKEGDCGPSTNNRPKGNLNYDGGMGVVSIKDGVVHDIHAANPRLDVCPQLVVESLTPSRELVVYPRELS